MPIEWKSLQAGPGSTIQSKPLNEPRVRARFGEWTAVGPNREAALSQLRSQSYSDILRHEQAHASKAGGLAGGIQINYNSEGIAVSGSVPVHFGMNPADPEGSYANAQTAYAAALAPDKPSGADFGVAAKAQAIMGQSQLLMQQKSASTKSLSPSG